MSINFEGTGPDRSPLAAGSGSALPTGTVIPFPSATTDTARITQRHEVPEQPSGIPAGYFVQDNYLCTTKTDKNGAEDVVKLCPTFTIEARYRLNDGRGWGRVISFTDPDGRQHRLQVLDRDLAARPQEVLAKMADMGFELSFDKAARDAVLTLIRAWRPGRTLSSVSTFGWTDDTLQSFVFRPDKVIGGDNVTAGFDADPGIVGAVREAGTLDDWRDRVGALCSGNPILVFAASVAFVGPLLDLLGLPGCGFHLHGLPGQGKSTALYVAASVFGDRSFLGSWNTTKNALEGQAAARNHTVLILDEISEAPAPTLAEAIYMIGNGQGKARAGARGETTPRARFRLALLSSGELTSRVHGAIAGRQMPDGTSIRLIDLRADVQQLGAFDSLNGAASAAEFAVQFDRATQVVFGTAGRRYIEMLIRDRGQRDGWRQMHHRFTQHMLRSLNSSHVGQVERVVSRTSHRREAVPTLGQPRDITELARSARTKQTSSFDRTGSMLLPRALTESRDDPRRVWSRPTSAHFGFTDCPLPAG